METLRLVLLFFHLVGMAALFGGWFVQMSAPTKRLLPAMSHGALTQLVSGVLLTFVRGDQPEVDSTKVMVKGLVLLAILALLWVNRRRPTLSSTHYLAIGLLTLANVAVAVFWT